MSRTCAVAAFAIFLIPFCMAQQAGPSATRTAGTKIVKKMGAVGSIDKYAELKCEDGAACWYHVSFQPADETPYALSWFGKNPAFEPGSCAVVQFEIAAGKWMTPSQVKAHLPKIVSYKQVPQQECGKAVAKNEAEMRNEPLIMKRNDGYGVVLGNVGALFPCKPTMLRNGTSTVFSCLREELEDPLDANNIMLHASPRTPSITKVEYKLVISKRDGRPMPSEDELLRSTRSKHSAQTVISSSAKTKLGQVSAEIEFLYNGRHTVQREIVTPEVSCTASASVLHRNGHRDPLNYVSAGLNASDYPVVQINK